MTARTDPPSGITPTSRTRISAWLAGRAGPDGHVLATDIDTSWIDGAAPHVEVRRHDIARDDPPPGVFDLIHARTTCPALRALRSLPLAAALAGSTTIGLTLAACGQAGPAAVSRPPSSAQTAEQAAVTNWLVKTNQMWTSNDFAALDQVTTGQMRTIYLSEQRQARLPANASRMAFQLTGLSIKIPCHTGSPAVFVAYADTDVFDLGTGTQSAAMLFQRTGGRWKLATAVTHPAGSAWPALCTKGTPPVTPPVLAPGSYIPALARVLTSAATGAAQTVSMASPFTVNGFLSGPGSIPAQFATWISQDRQGGVSLTGRFTPPTPRSRYHWRTAVATG